VPLATSKIELLEKLSKAYVNRDTEFDAITPDLERQKGIEGEVSCYDIVAYQIGWGKLLLGWEKSELAGKIPKMPAAGYQWNQLGDLANSFYR